MDEGPVQARPAGDSVAAEQTPFVGRSRELREIERLFGQPDCRLLTLIGPGGVGKTRLALEYLRVVNGRGEGGGVFVQLQAVTSAEGFVVAIADALGQPLRSSEDLLEQLVSRLEAMQALLVLDNFEQLTDVASASVVELLRGAPGIRLLVTSREPLKLNEEWTYHIDGLPYPEGSDEANFADYDAVRLFTRRLARTRPQNDLTGSLGDIARICRLVAGMPLALELAAGWGRTLECREIADEIERNTDFLQSSARNPNERHRSMRAIFEQSWQRMEGDERDVLKRLAVFRGSFRRAAAEAIGGADLATLSSLIDKSLLRQAVGGRYELHELVRQYAFERLAEVAADVESVGAAHCDHYCARLEHLYTDALAGKQIELCVEIEEERENFRAAWSKAVGGARVDRLTQGRGALAMFGQLRSRYLEAATELSLAIAMLEDAVETDRDAAILVARLLVDVSWFEIRLGRFQQSESDAQRSTSIYERLSLIPEGWAADPAGPLSVLASIRGDYAEAQRLGLLAEERARLTSNPMNQDFACYLLTRAAQLSGREADAERYAREGEAIAKRIGDRWFDGYLLLERGNVALASGRPDEARRHYEACFAIKQDFHDAEGMAVALIGLGDTVAQMGRHQEALDIFDRSIALYRDLHDVGGEASARASMARVAMQLGRFDESTRLLTEAMSLATSIGFVPLLLSIFATLAEQSLHQSGSQDVADLVRFLMQHPATDFETESRLQELVAEARIDLARPASFESALLIVEAMLHESAVEAYELLRYESVAVVAPTATHRRHPDDLTDREIEVLRLIAEGKSNRQIGETLFISANTAANHVKSILAKTGSANRAEATAFASSKGLLTQ